MYIDLKNFLIKNPININGVVHVGAHKGEELNLYRSLKIKKVLLFEANPSLIKFLRDVFPALPVIAIIFAKEFCLLSLAN